jgi:hypothetical protein
MIPSNSPWRNLKLITQTGSWLLGRRVIKCVTIFDGRFGSFHRYYRPDEMTIRYLVVFHQVFCMNEYQCCFLQFSQISNHFASAWYCLIRYYCHESFGGQMSEALNRYRQNTRFISTSNLISVNEISESRIWSLIVAPEWSYTVLVLLS